MTPTYRPTGQCQSISCHPKWCNLWSDSGYCRWGGGKGHWGCVHMYIQTPHIFFGFGKGCFTQCFTRGATSRNPLGSSGEPSGYQPQPLSRPRRPRRPQWHKKTPTVWGGPSGFRREVSVGYVYIPRRAYNPIVLSRFGFVKGCG